MIKNLRILVTSSLKYKLLVLVLLPVMLIMISVITMAYLWVNEVSYRQLLMKVNADLNIAHEAFIDTQNKYLSELALLAESYQFRVLMELPFTEMQESFEMRALIDALKKEKGFDFIQMIDVNGCDYWQSNICNIKKGSLFKKASMGLSVTGVDIMTSDELRKIGPELVAKAFLTLISTPREHPSKIIAEGRGMVLQSYYPIISLDKSEKKIKAILIGGVLLNKNFEVVDTLRDLVYSKGSLAEGGLGTVTIFLEDIRISTNVPGQLPDQRALGTRVSEEVRKKVLTQGVKWVDRAFVVSEWYISAYEPIVDVDGSRVGMLYTGFLESPFRETYFTGLTVLMLMFTIVIGLASLLAVIGAKSIYKPIGAMARVVDTIRHGDEVRIGKLESEDELAILARQFDDMLDTLQEQRTQIQNAADELEIKVEDRTRQLRNQKLDLEHNIKLLKQTREKLITSEKLAAIGELSAGIAHEINNPTAVILGNMDLLIQELDDNGVSVKRESELIIQQVYRIRSIINNLLHYSRPSDYQTTWSEVDINEVINDTRVLIHHDLDQRNIKLNFDLRSTFNICGNHQQYQQVLINLIVNAMHAQETDGKITIRTRNWKNKGVLMVIRDNGCGISKEAMSRIFDPFYTQTKSGTGLGLYVSSGILSHFGAEIMVRSRVGVGSCFFIWFYSELPQQLKNDAAIQSFKI
jgi:two-component system, NtrC family, sensor kinase